MLDLCILLFGIHRQGVRLSPNGLRLSLLKRLSPILLLEAPSPCPMYVTINTYQRDTIQAFHYCERIAKSICKSPTHYSQTLVNQLVNLSDQLRNHDPQMQAGVTQAENLRWLETLRNIVLRMQVW